MKSFRILTAALCFAAVLSLSACKTEVKTDEHGDTTTTVTPAAPHDSTVSGAGQEMKDESVEKMVEAALVAKPGFEGVTVESAPEGVIILNGTVKSENEKAQAQVVAENTAGVKKVTNNLTVQK